MISRRPLRLGQVEVDRAVEAARAQQRGVEIVGPVGGPDHQDVGRAASVGALICRCDGTQRLTRSMPQSRTALTAGRRVERLELDEQLVHHAGDALASGRRPHARAGRADGVDLLDEPDGAALLAGRLAQRP